MPQPSSSIQPDCLHLRQPFPPQKMQLICTSARGLGEGKERRKEARFHRRAEQRLHGVVERALQVAEGDVGVDAEPLHLVKDGRVRGVGGVVAMDFAGNDDAHRRRLLLHGAHLHGRGVRAQQQAVAQRTALLVGDDQRVLRVARRMAGRKVHALEVVEVGFDFGTDADRVAQRREHGVISFSVRVMGCSAPVRRRVPGSVMSMASAASAASLGPEPAA